MPNKLSLNIEKNSFVSVKSDTQVKYLGLIFDSSLNGRPYLQELSKKVSRGIAALSKIRYYVNKHVTSILLFNYLTLLHLQSTVYEFGAILIVPPLKLLMTLQKRPIHTDFFKTRWTLWALVCYTTIEFK